MHRRTASTAFKEIWQGIWQGICSPKIEIFLWQLLNGRVMVKDAMKKCGERGVFGKNALVGGGLVAITTGIFKFKHFKKGSLEPVSTLLLNLKDLCVEKKKQKSYQLKDWIPLAVDSLKFNVDGSSRGNLGPAVIGGVLRDSKGLGDLLILSKRWNYGLQFGQNSSH
ncbi:hypothetical protein Dsin_013105 [Dipteronia sinensis]|uniref:Reverse transcriptase zinc-binding domain-containing protein n=1 Tax=Dipteronia sinensis TaxID=43782 RepID=A0AAE0AK64_9ROSI|nr:hypothetical protein Dsin_013105 [Dipteronia sinensis]